MARIHLLADEVINKIAAGEVVERPASVVKELVENAIDAGAGQIAVALELGGARSIAVTDDGSGIAKDDAMRALTRHATSKIRAADDLFQIQTMGFRGEALASIAAVSRLSLATTERGEGDGVKIQIAGGEPPLTLPWSGAAGTTVAVENLFYNVPVRAKFLKAPATEFGHCLELVQAFALCHPEIGFTVTHNGREQFRVVAATDAARDVIGEAALRERAKAVLGKDAAQLLYVRSSSRYGELEALVSPPGLERPTSKQVFTFVNGRWVKDKTLRYGLLRGYHSHILKGRFPVAVLHLRMDPTLVDVNVHPAKTELRFQYPGEVQNLIALAIREKLRDGAWSGPDDGAGLLEFSRNTIHGATGATGAATGGTASRFVAGSEPRYGADAAVARRAFEGRRPSYGGGTADVSRGDLGAVRDQHDLAALLASPSGSTEPAIPWAELEYLGSFDRCFLFFNVKERLLVIDQHAFHERILYERLLKDESLLAQSQAMLVPESLELAPTEVQALRTRRAALAKRGFDFQVEGDTTVVVRAVPSLLAKRDPADLFADLARGPDGLDDEAHDLEPNDSNAEMARLILAKAACHAAVRAGEELPEGELTQLLAEAHTVDFFHNCPHGRRVFKWWSREQVARWFDR